ncbi:major facilitator superfamily domain-containing protein [Ochromonadaceae sp. CCMP2298]|nr:major facilitator superfamily domain-containing protein [Ochromonadaceae sp. CCMP2298]
MKETYQPVMEGEGEEGEGQRDYSMAINGYVTFIGDAARGVLFPALWPLCQSLGGDRVTLGYLVATFSVGRLVVTNKLGQLTDQHRHRIVLLGSAAVLCVGVGAWALAGLPSLSSLYVLFGAQFILGLGTGTLGVTRSYVAERCPPSQRTVQLARLSALQYAGFSATPLMGSALVVAGAAISAYMQVQMPLCQPHL